MHGKVDDLEIVKSTPLYQGLPNHFKNNAISLINK